MTDGPIKLLLIEDDPQTIKQCRALLAPVKVGKTQEPAYELLQVERIVTAVAYLKNIHFDAILLGTYPADAQGLGVADLAQRLAQSVPIIVLTVADSMLAASAAIEAGADDCLPKDALTGVQLEASVHIAMVRQKRSGSQLASDAHLSPLTEPERLIARTPDGIVVVAKSGEVRFANPAAAHILQQPASELIGSEFSLPLPKGDTTEFNVTQAGETVSSIEMRLTEIEWQGERVYLAALRDITNHLRDKVSISEKAAELEMRNIALGEFAQTMAHQVKGLLSQMIGYAGLLDLEMVGVENEKWQAAVKGIVLSGHKMNNVISELLLLANIRTGDVSVEPLDMPWVLAEALKRIRYQVEQAQVVINQPEAWPVSLGHSSWIEEVWVNYVSNGIKYGGDPPLIELGAEQLPDEMVRFWVRDNGIGIAEVNHSQLFKPHTRFGPRPIHGEGLGLSIVHRIVAKCGGQVGVESEVGVGSTFWFTLPLAGEAVIYVNH